MEIDYYIRSDISLGTAAFSNENYNNNNNDNSASNLMMHARCSSISNNDANIYVDEFTIRPMDECFANNNTTQTIFYTPQQLHELNLPATVVHQIWTFIVDAIITDTFSICGMYSFVIV